MDFKQLVLGEADIVYQDMLNNITKSPLTKSVSVAESNTYSRNRNNYYNRLNIENNTFNTAIKEIKKAKEERLERENLLRLEIEQKREENAAKMQLVKYWLVVLTLIIVNLLFAHNAMKVAFQDVDGSGVGLPWSTLWPSWISIVVSFIVIAILSLNTFIEPEFCIGVIILEVLALLVFGIVTACKCPTGYLVSNAIIGLIRCVIAYIVPVVGGGAVALMICFRD